MRILEFVVLDDEVSLRSLLVGSFFYYQGLKGIKLDDKKFIFVGSVEIGAIDVDVKVRPIKEVYER